MKNTYRKKPLLSSCSANVLILAINKSSYPKNSSNINRENASPKHLSFNGSKVTILTGMFSLCRAAGDNRKKPYSNEYSTIYPSSGNITKNLR